jgi:RHS repeat-associated protein
VDHYRHFYYTAGWQLLETRLSDSENTEPETLDVEMQYVWSARYMDAPVLRDKNTDSDDLCDDERLYFANDANMNVTALVESDGDVVERYVYDPYGKVTIYDGTWANTRSTSSYDNNILFAGYYHDWETGLYHVRNRYYHPYFGWITRDPAGYADGMSLYEYCRSGPLGALDAMGLCQAPGQPGPGAEGGGSNTAKKPEGGEPPPPPEKLPWDPAGGPPPPPQEPWQPKNEGPVRRGGGGGGGSDDEEFSWWGTFASALGQQLAGRVEGMIRGLDPATWVEGGIRDYEAGIRRGQSGFDAALDAIARNTPGLNVGTGVAEAIKGTHLGGPLHGQPLEWYDRTARVGNWMTYEAACGLGYCAAKGYNPTLGGSALSTPPH